MSPAPQRIDEFSSGRSPLSAAGGLPSCHHETSTAWLPAASSKQRTPWPGVSFAFFAAWATTPVRATQILGPETVLKNNVKGRKRFLCEGTGEQAGCAVRSAERLVKQGPLKGALHCFNATDAECVGRITSAHIPDLNMGRRILRFNLLGRSNQPIFRLGLPRSSVSGTLCTLRCPPRIIAWLAPPVRLFTFIAPREGE
jgi:hypothetical protein